MTAVVEPAAPAVAAAGAPARARPGEWAIAALVLGLLLGAAPQVSALFWTPKVAVALVAIGPGLVALVLAALARDRAAWAGLMLLAVAALATVLSPSPLLALTGLYNEGTGLLFVVAAVGMWALGRRLGPAGRQLLLPVILGAAVVNAVMVWLQMSSAFHGALFARVDGRGVGLLGNPVHTTGFLVGATALAAELWPRDVAVGDGAPDAGGAVARAARLDPRTLRILLLALVAAYASAIQLTGGRIGIVLLAAVALRTVVRVGIRRCVPLVVAVVVGVGCASVALSSGSGAADRLATSGSSSFDGRIDRWRMAVPAVRARPVLGIGPGLYRRATSPHDTAAAARAFGADALNRDAHDLFVQSIVTTGILGLAALVLWLVVAALGARGPLAWFTAFGGASLLIQPAFVGLTPVLALALGAAAARPARAFGRAGVAVAVGLAVAGGCLGAWLLRGDAVLADAQRTDSVAQARRAPRVLPVWPEPYLAASRIEGVVARRTGAAGHRRRAIAAARGATRRDPSDPATWNTLGGLEADRGSVRAAERAYATALRWNPYSLAALGGLATLAAADGDAARAERYCRKVHAVSPHSACPAKPSR